MPTNSNVKEDSAENDNSAAETTISKDAVLNKEVVAEASKPDDKATM